MTYIYCMETITSHVINVTPELNLIIKKSFDFKISRTLTINIEFIHNGYLCSLKLNSKTQLTSIICVQKTLSFTVQEVGLKFFLTKDTSVKLITELHSICLQNVLM